jgi:hypothetical protein
VIAIKVNKQAKKIKGQIDLAAKEYYFKHEEHQKGLDLER